MWVCKSDTRALVVRVLWSPEMQFLCPRLVGVCWETGATEIMHGICFRMQLEWHVAAATSMQTIMHVRARKLLAGPFEIKVLALP